MDTNLGEQTTTDCTDNTDRIGERARLLGKMLSSLAAINVVRSNVHCYDYITFNVKGHA